LYKNELTVFLLFFNNNTNKIAIDINKAITPSILLGILRKIAYANKKYHSGWMCLGVINELASMKFSGSIKLYPYTNLNMKKKYKIIMNSIESLNVNE